MAGNPTHFESNAMRINQNLFAVSAALMLSPCGLFAQNQLQLTISGTSSTTDSDGKIVSTSINNQSLLKSFAATKGVNDLTNLALAYHIHGNELGDTIDVINRKSGATVYTMFGLYFGEDFGRTALLSRSGRQLRRLEYVYTEQNSHSLGSVLLTNYYFLDENGSTNATAVLGQMQYIVTPDANHTNTQVCTAKFLAWKPWTFSP
jgi:hypothetical protein